MKFNDLPETCHIVLLTAHVTGPSELGNGGGMPSFGLLRGLKRGLGSGPYQASRCQDSGVWGISRDSI